MREIKFRGRCSSMSAYKGEWVYGSLIQCDNGHALIVHSFDDCTSSTYHVDADTVGQYIDMADSQWQDIYEDDFVQDIHGNIYLIEWDNESARFLAEGKNGLFGGTTFESCKVIGNIHDNPELMDKLRQDG